MYHILIEIAKVVGILAAGITLGAYAIWHSMSRERTRTARRHAGRLKSLRDAAQRQYDAFGVESTKLGAMNDAWQERARLLELQLADRDGQFTEADTAAQAFQQEFEDLLVRHRRIPAAFRAEPAQLDVITEPVDALLAGDTPRLEPRVAIDIEAMIASLTEDTGSWAGDWLRQNVRVVDGEHGPELVALPASAYDTAVLLDGVGDRFPVVSRTLPPRVGVKPAGRRPKKRGRIPKGGKR